MPSPAPSSNLPFDQVRQDCESHRDQQRCQTLSWKKEKPFFFFIFLHCHAFLRLAEGAEAARQLWQLNRHILQTIGHVLFGLIGFPMNQRN